jgi:sugar (pentulose or hexulose) kinase
MSQDSYLVVDAGSGGVKSFLISPSGLLLGRSERVWDRDSWTCSEAWTLIKESIHELMNKQQLNLLGVCDTSMREEFVLLDEEGSEINVQLSTESEKYGYSVLSEYGESMYRSSGHWPVPNWMAGAILPWLYHAKPKLFERITSVLMISDWVNFMLSGEAATEGSSACETSLFNITDYTWDWDIIESLGLPHDIFPKVFRNGEYLGRISSNISKETGIPEDAPLIIGGADTQCGLLGVAAFNGEAVAVGGTTTPVQVVIDQPLIDQRHRTWSNNYLLEDTWVIESNAGNTGLVVKWLRDEFTKHDSSYNELNRLVAKAPPGSDSLLTYLGPHIFDSGPPYWPKDKLGNLPIEPTITGNNRFKLSALCRSVIEANCYAVKANLLQLMEITNQRFNSLKFCGGNSRSELWMQLQADVLGIQVNVPVVRDATALGAAVLASIGTGYYRNVNEAVEGMVKIGFVYEPSSKLSQIYESHYDRWIRTREKLGK